MRRDAQVAHAGIGRQHDGERGWLAPGAGPLIQEMGDGRRAHRSTRERVAERRAPGLIQADAGETSAHRIEGEADPLLVVTDGAPGLIAGADPRRNGDDYP